MIIVSPVDTNKKAIPMQQKSRILQFMKSAKVMAVAPMMYKDRETGKSAIEAFYQQSGDYCWSSDTLYHFEHYNYSLPQDFIEYVLK